MIARLLMFGLLAFFASISVLRQANAQNFNQGVWTFQLKGAIGSYPAGLTISVQGGTKYISGHFYYSPTFEDISLQGIMASSGLNLVSSRGNVFRLQYVRSAGNPSGTVTNFLTSIGLSGSFQNKEAILPTNFILWDAYPGIYGGTSYSKVTPESDAKFEQMVRRFLNGVLTKNKNLAASAIAFPLTVSDTTITTKSELFARWNYIFTPRFIKVLQAAIPHEMPVANGQVRIGEMIIIGEHAQLSPGAAWFDQDGADFLTPPLH